MQHVLYNIMVSQYETREKMGRAAADDCAVILQLLLGRKKNVRMIFAAAPSQDEFLAALAADKRVDFSRIEAFHMDEYVGLPEQSPQRFGNYLREHIFSIVPFAAVHYLNGNAENIEAESARYAALLTEKPIDIVCMGIGENAHIAFNDPHVADFDDSKDVKCVSLDHICRMQQVHDGCFARIEDVPTHALTLSVPMLMRASHHICVVPTVHKAQAVYDMIHGQIGSHCPATALRLCQHAAVYLDVQSASLLHYINH